MESKLEDPFRPLQLEDLSIGEQQQRCYMEPNGMMFPKFPDELCLCQHRLSQHLFSDNSCPFNDSICLEKSCICDEYRAPSVATNKTTIKKESKPRQLEEEIVVQDGKITQNNDRFLRQYGLV